MSNDKIMELIHMNTIANSKKLDNCSIAIAKLEVKIEDLKSERITLASEKRSFEKKLNKIYIVLTALAISGSYAGTKISGIISLIK